MKNIFFQPARRIICPRKKESRLSFYEKMKRVIAYLQKMNKGRKMW